MKTRGGKETETRTHLQEPRLSPDHCQLLQGTQIQTLSDRRPWKTHPTHTRFTQVLQTESEEKPVR